MGLHSAGLGFEDLESRPTDFGSGPTLGVYTLWGSTLWVSTVPGNEERNWGSTLGVYALRVGGLESRATNFDLVLHSPDWGIYTRTYESP